MNPANSMRWSIVLLFGAFSTAVTLALCWLIEYFSGGRLRPMGLFLAGVLPLGAVFIGAGAAAGYAAGAFITGTRIRARLLVTILCMTCLSYFVMQYLEYVVSGAQISFFDYFDLSTRCMRLVFGTPNLSTGKDDLSVGLGVMGYALRLLELIAFSLGALMLPLFLRTRRYCEDCRRYHENYRLTTVPASVKCKQLIGQSGDPQIEAQHAAAAAQAEKIVAEFADAICADDPATVLQLVDRLKSGVKAANRRARRVELRLSRCFNCGRGVVYPRMIFVKGQHDTSKKELWSVSVEPEFVDAIRPRY